MTKMGILVYPQCARCRYRAVADWCQGFVGSMLGKFDQGIVDVPLKDSMGKYQKLFQLERRPLRYSSQATPIVTPESLKHAWLLPGHDERLPGSWRVDSWYKSIIFIRMFGSGEVVTWSAYMPLHKILILANSENDDLFFFAYFRFRSTMSCNC